MVLDFDVTVTQGGFTLEAAYASAVKSLALFGASGSGKTTLVETIAGLRRPSRGHIHVRDRVLFSSSASPAVDLPVHRRHVGYVPQDLALFPHMNVRRNVLYGAERGASSMSLERVVAVLEIDGLLSRAVSDLSGGERQRVAVARALMSAPDLLLMDEPLASVDLPLRKRIVPYLQRVRDNLQVPVVYVSHDQEEVRAIGEWVLTLDRGRIVASERA
jgi:molybdate transport system ATP-binding protein